MLHPYCSHSSRCCQGLHHSSFPWPKHVSPTNQTKGGDTALLGFGINIQSQQDLIIHRWFFHCLYRPWTCSFELNSSFTIILRRSKYRIKKKQASMIICWSHHLLGKEETYLKKEKKSSCTKKCKKKCKMICSLILHYVFRVGYHG